MKKCAIREQDEEGHREKEEEEKETRQERERQTTHEQERVNGEGRRDSARLNEPGGIEGTTSPLKATSPSRITLEL